MLSLVLPELQSIFDRSDQPDVILPTLLSFLSNHLQCDRCFIYLRHPVTKMGKVPHCWRRHADIPLVLDDDWKPEPNSLPDEDPMFAAALRAEPSIFVEDVETASPEILNREFEQREFGHRALIHAHLRQDGQLWGVLQPCTFEQPHPWTQRDRQLIATVEPKLLPIAIAYVQSATSFS